MPCEVSHSETWTLQSISSSTWPFSFYWWNVPCHTWCQIFWTIIECGIFNLVVQLQNNRVSLEQLYNADEFLLVCIKNNSKTIFLNIMQKRLIKYVLETLCLDVRTMNRKFTFTPTKGKSLMCNESLPLVMSTS